MIRILIIDERATVREGIAMALSTEFEVRACSKSEDGLALLQACGAEVVLLNYDAAGRQRLEGFLKALSERQVATRTMVISTDWLSAREQRRLARAGAAGVFITRKALRELVAAIRVIAGGGTWYDSGQTPLVVVPAPHGFERLSERERVVSNLVLEGLANKEIGARLDVSESYVKGVLQRVFLKLGVRSRGQLIRVLIEQQPLLEERELPSAPPKLELLSYPGKAKAASC